MTEHEIKQNILRRKPAVVPSAGTASTLVRSSGVFGSETTLGADGWISGTSGLGIACI